MIPALYSLWRTKLSEDIVLLIIPSRLSIPFLLLLYHDKEEGWSSPKISVGVSKSFVWDLLLLLSSYLFPLCLYLKGRVLSSPYYFERVILSDGAYSLLHMESLSCRRIFKSHERSIFREKIGGVALLRKVTTG